MGQSSSSEKMELFSDRKPQKGTLHQKSLKATGGGPFQAHLDEVSEAVLDANDGSSKEISNPYDSEALMRRLNGQDIVKISLGEANVPTEENDFDFLIEDHVSTLARYKSCHNIIFHYIYIN